MSRSTTFSLFFFFNDTATTEIYTLSLHDALPIYRDPQVLTISIHQDRLYPQDSGAIDERGEGPGAGFNINILLPPGSGHGAYLAALERVVVPALRAFRPALIVVPSGFDGSLYDPL